MACPGDPIECNYEAALGQLEEKVERLRQAITNKGVHPGYHDEQMKKLRLNWPTLWFAIQELIK